MCRWTRRRISHFCRSLFKKRNRNAPVQCLECGANMRIFTGMQRLLLQIRPAIYHAIAHLGKKLFACRRCDKDFATKSMIIRHLDQCHSLNGFAENYIDSTCNFFQEICAALERCFGERPDLIIHAKEEKEPVG